MRSSYPQVTMVHQRSGANDLIVDLFSDAETWLPYVQRSRSQELTNSFVTSRCVNDRNLPDKPKPRSTSYPVTRVRKG